MTKTVLFGAESRAKLLAGVKKIVDAVKVTMGANGKCVLIGDAYYNDGFIAQLPTVVSKDGWTVTKHFSLQDAVENRGAMMIKEAATKTVEQAGDATTCTCVLAGNLIENGMKLIEEGANSQQLKRGMDAALEYVVGELKKMSIPAKGDVEKIRQIATVSANNDTAIGDLIADAFSKIGDDGVIDIVESKTGQTEIKTFEGFKFDKGFVSPWFINKAAKETCEFDNPILILYEKRITHHDQFEPAFREAFHNNNGAERRPIVIICEDAEGEGLAVLVANKMKTGLEVCVVKAPEFGDARRESMEDIALLTGGTYISDSKGVGIKDIKRKHFGSATKIIVSKNETVIIGGASDGEKLKSFVGDLKANIENAKTEEEKYAIEKRIARLTGGFAVIQVGAATETEQKEKMDRVDDAVRATKAAIAEGFVAGGGTAFLRIPAHKLTGSKDFQLGASLVTNSLSAPLLQICENSGVDGKAVYEEVYFKKGNTGYNAMTDEIVDMVDAGIIDATKALRCALVNAVSVAGMVLTSECSITSIA